MLLVILEGHCHFFGFIAAQGSVQIAAGCGHDVTHLVAFAILAGAIPEIVLEVSARCLRVLDGKELQPSWIIVANGANDLGFAVAIQVCGGDRHRPGLVEVVSVAAPVPKVFQIGVRVACIVILGYVGVWILTTNESDEDFIVHSQRGPFARKGFAAVDGFRRRGRSRHLFTCSGCRRQRLVAIA